MKAKLLYESRCKLGEGPYWHSERQSIFWLDIENKTLNELPIASDKIKSINLPQRSSTIVQGQDERLILGVQGGLATLNLDTEEVTWLMDIEKNYADRRTNDGKCSPNGSLLIGIMNLQCKEGKGSLYLVNDNLELRKILSNLSIPNGMAWSPLDQQMFFIDSPSYKITSFHLNEQTGAITDQKTVVQISKGLGMPDGMTIDKEGCLWVAHWGGYGVYRWNPATGQLVDKIDVPAPHVTCCVFGGENMDELFITTARDGLTNKQLKEYPLSGSLFVAKTTTSGFLPNKFAGHLKP